MSVRRAPRKSIIASFGAFSEPEREKPAEPENSGSGQPASPEGSPDLRRSGRVGAGVIGATQRTLTELREERDRLQALVNAGGSVKLDPAAIDPSPFVDRLPEDTDADFERFRKLIGDEGQKVPIQVRPHPTDEGRFQVIYGHRRWRATKELGIQVDAIILSLDDSELVMAQGIENAARQDLTWIERALFVRQMDDAEIRARDIRATLSIDDAELARLRSVVKTVPSDVIRLIGRAPKVGRPRWCEFARVLDVNPRAVANARRALSADKASTALSDERFRQALSSIKESTAPSRKAFPLRDRSGKVVGKMTVANGGIKLAVDKDIAPQFREFIEHEFEGLMDRFFDENENS